MLCLCQAATIHITVTTTVCVHHSSPARRSQVCGVKRNLFFFWLAQTSLWTSTDTAFLNLLGIISRGRYNFTSTLPRLPLSPLLAYPPETQGKLSLRLLLVMWLSCLLHKSRQNVTISPLPLPPIFFPLSSPKAPQPWLPMGSISPYK